MKTRHFLIACLLVTFVAGCKSSTEPTTPLTVSGGNDILVAGNTVVVLANGSNSLYVLDLSDISSTDRALLILNEGNFGKSNSSLDVVIFHKNGQVTDTLVEHNFLPDSTARLLKTIPLRLVAQNKMA